MLFRDLYAIVGVEAGATPDEIRDASERHPLMKDPESKAAERVRSARDALLDSAVRTTYDLLRPVMDCSIVDAEEANKIDMEDLDAVRTVRPGSLLDLHVTGDDPKGTLALCLDGQVVLRCDVAVSGYPNSPGRWLLRVTEISPKTDAAT